LFFHSQFTEPKVTSDNSLFSMVDLHVIISGLIQSLAPTGGAGANGTLELPEAREMVHVEDHEGYSTKIGDVVRKWAVFSPDFEYFESLGKELVIKLKVTNAQSALVNGVLQSQEYLKKYSSGYADLKYQFETLAQGFTRAPQEKIASWEKHSTQPKVNIKFKRLFWRLVTLPTALVRRLSPWVHALLQQTPRAVSKSGSNKVFQTKRKISPSAEFAVTGTL